MRKSFQAICWDHDGLLVDTESLFFNTTRDLFAAEGIALSPVLWSREYLSKGRSTTSIGEELGIPGERLRQILDERNRRYRALLETEPPFCPHAWEVLVALSRAYPMALVTGSPRANIHTVHRNTGMLALFRHVICQEDYQATKPAPDPYLTAAARLGVAPERCLAIEDSERGLRSALAAGMTCVAVPGPLTRGRQTFLGALSIEESLDAIPSIVERGLTTWGTQPAERR